MVVVWIIRRVGVGIKIRGWQSSLGVWGISGRYVRAYEKCKQNLQLTRALESLGNSPQMRLEWTCTHHIRFRSDRLSCPVAASCCPELGSRSHQAGNRFWVDRHKTLAHPSTGLRILRAVRHQSDRSLTRNWRVGLRWAAGLALSDGRYRCRHWYRNSWFRYNRTLSLKQETGTGPLRV